MDLDLKKYKLPHSLQEIRVVFSNNIQSISQTVVMLYSILTIPLLVLYSQTKCIAAADNLQIDGRYVLTSQR